VTIHLRVEDPGKPGSAGLSVVLSAIALATAEALAKSDVSPAYFAVGVIAANPAYPSAMINTSP